MMEQADPGEAHGDPVLVAGLDHIIIPDRAARLRDVTNAAPVCPFHIVSEGEECVRTESHIRILLQPFLSFFSGEDRRLLRKKAAGGRPEELLAARGGRQKAGADSGIPGGRAVR